MRTWSTLPSEHRRTVLRSLKYAAERAEVAFGGLQVSGPSVSRSAWQAELRRLDKEITRAWCDYAELLFVPLNGEDPVVCEDQECVVCP